MNYIYTVFRTDTKEYYKGDNSYSFKDRWNINLDKAKKFKRKGDASNAISNMIDMHPKELWMKIENVFLIKSFVILHSENFVYGRQRK